MIEGFSDFEVIGRGGFSVVYSAKEAYVDRVVAIKILHGVTTDDLMARDRFLREVKAMGRLSGIPNIVDVYRPVFTDRGEPCIVMPYFAGRDLSERLATVGPLEPTEVRRVGLTVATALAAAHSRGIFHRDIKPENILLDDEGMPSLGDFGIAVMHDLRAGSATAATLSPVHAPPERLAPPTDGLTTDDAAGDVYSLGSTLYTLLAGKGPFGDPQTIGSHEFTIRVLHQPPAEISRPGAPSKLTQVLLQCIQKDPSLRPSVEALTRALEHLKIPEAPVVEPGSNRPTVQVQDVSPPQPADVAVTAHRSPPTDAGVIKPGPAAVATDQQFSESSAKPGDTVHRSQIGPQPIVLTVPRKKSNSRSKIIGVVAGVVAVFALTLVGSQLLAGGGSAPTTTLAPPTTSVTSAAMQRATIQEVKVFADRPGFSVRWTDPNSPPAPLRYLIVEVDGEPGIPEDLSSSLATGEASEFIVEQIQMPGGQSVVIDLNASQYCMTVVLGTESQADETVSDRSCVGIGT